MASGDVRNGRDASCPDLSTFGALLKRHVCCARQIAHGASRGGGPSTGPSSSPSRLHVAFGTVPGRHRDGVQTGQFGQTRRLVLHSLVKVSWCPTSLGELLLAI